MFIPEASQHDKADNVTDEGCPMMKKHLAKLADGAFVGKIGHLELKYQDGHRDCKNTIKEKLQTNSSNGR